LSHSVPCLLPLPRSAFPNRIFAYFQFIAGLVFYPEYSTSHSTTESFYPHKSNQHTFGLSPPSIVLIFTTMDCFGDFCLACDKQTNGTPFCSQACRLAELDHSLSSSEPASPGYTRHGTSQRSPGFVTTGFQLPPAIDFLSYRREKTLQLSTGQAKSATAASHSINEASSSTTFPRSAHLTPSSSQTSLSSLRTNQSSPGGISEQAWVELRNYASGFDQVRALKRRMSTL
jgi:ECL1/2/3 zinc binding proteins